MRIILKNDLEYPNDEKINMTNRILTIILDSIAHFIPIEYNTTIKWFDLGKSFCGRIKTVVISMA